MFGIVEITPWHWAGFIICVLFFLALDLGVFHRRAHTVKFKEAFLWTGVWVALSLLFGLVVAPMLVEGWTHKQTAEFVTGYIIEFSLSMDNVFVMAVIFSYFKVPSQYQHRVLFWGILGALLMRGAMIAAGAALIKQFMWLLYFFGAFLVFTGIKMLFTDESGVHPEKNRVLKLAKKIFPVTADFHGQKFAIRNEHGMSLTPLALVLLMVETTDLIFAVDSIPAIFAVTQKPFIVFTSNVCAILGLRSLYFVLAGAIDYFRYLKVGLSFVLVFIGVKMLIDPHEQEEKWFQFEIPSSVALLTVAGIITMSIALSVTAAYYEKKNPKAKKSKPD